MNSLRPRAVQWRRVLARLLCVVPAAVLILSLAPDVARCDGSDGRRYFFEDIFMPFFVKDADGLRYRNQRPGSSPSSFPIRKDAGTIRIFVVGGSIALRYMSAAHHSPISRLQRDLGPALQGAGIEALDCGMAGYDSDREAQIVEELPRYSPDAIVLMSGHNERMISTYWPGVPLWMLHATNRLNRLAAFKSSIDKIQQIRQIQPQDSKEAALVMGHFEKNLREMIRRSKARGIPVVLALPPINYRDSAPHNHEVQKDPRFISGMARYLRGDAAQASRTWREMLPTYRQNPHFGGVPVLLFYMARAAERLHKFTEADRDYEQLAKIDFTAGFCAADCQEAIRKTAREEDVPLADLDGAFRRISAPRLPGLEMFNDSVHWNHRYDGVVSAQIASALRSERGLSRWTWDAKRLNALGATSWSGRSDEEEAMATLRYAVALMSAEKGAGEGQLSIKALAYIERVYSWYPRWFLNNDKLIRELEDENSKGAAWGMPPLNIPRPTWYWHVGQVLLAAGEYRRAQTLFSYAVKLDPKLTEVFISRAAAETFLGASIAASADLQEAQRLGGPDSDAAAWKAALLDQ